MPSGDFVEEGRDAFRESDEARRILERAAADMASARGHDAQVDTASIRPLSGPLVTGGGPLVTGWGSHADCVAAYSASFGAGSNVSLQEIHALCAHILAH
jgi:hypothetical protein